MADAFRLEVDERSVNVLFENIEKFRYYITHRAVVQAMESWGVLVQEAAKTLVPVDTGALRDSINWLVIEATEDFIKVKVSCQDPDGIQLPYAWITEVGGVINAKPDSLLHWIDRETGENRYAKQVYHPAQPFMYPALMSSMDEGIKLMEAAFAEAAKEAI